MDHRITQCPRCGTSFRVTEAHLAVAAGAVRCGSCLHIFNAREHWVEAAPPAPAEPEKPITAENIEDVEIDDDALFDDDTPLFDEEAESVKTKSGSIFNPVDDDFEVIDDSGPEKFSESFLDINSWEEDSGHNFQRESNTDLAESEEESADAAWAQKLLEEDAENSELELGASARSDVFDEFDSMLDAVPEIEESEVESASSATSGSSEFSEEFLNLGADYAVPREALKTAAAPAEETEQDSLAAEPEPGANAEQPLFALREFEQEPIRLHQFVHESRWPKILWRTGLIAALALGIGQYAYFNFNELARGTLRPYLTRACELFGCVLPPQLDIAQIRTNSLIVRSHPKQRGALAVDAVIVNQADFPQPYPVLQLQFSDLNGAPIAGRRFHPNEYLSGELAGSKLMPVRQPVHIALELVDPGTRAVNYQLVVVAPESPR